MELLPNRGKFMSTKIPKNLSRTSELPLELIKGPNFPLKSPTSYRSQLPSPGFGESLILTLKGLKCPEIGTSGAFLCLRTFECP